MPTLREQIVLSDGQKSALTENDGHHLLQGAAGSGRTTTALAAVQNAVEKYGLDQVWVITSSRSSASIIRNLLIGQNSATTPRVFTISALAYAMLRTQYLLDSAGEISLTMLTGPQQEARIKKLIAAEDFHLPKRWRQAKETRVFAADLRRYLDISSAQGAEHPDAEAARFLQAFKDAMNERSQLAAEIDYTQANISAAELLSSEDFAAAKIFSPQAIIVDDLHDFDKSQLRLLITFIKLAKYSFVTSNSDAAVLGFRGVGIEITKLYRDEITPSSHLLNEIFRHGKNIGAFSRELLPSQIAPDISQIEEKAIRRPEYRSVDVDEVNFEVSASPAIRDSLIVDRIMRAHVNEHVAFSEIAVIGRSFSTLSNLRRALAEAAIPVEFSPDNVAIAADPAAVQLIAGLKLTVGSIETKSTADLMYFLQSEIVAISAAQMRHTAQKLRSYGLFGPTEEVLANVLRNPVLLADIPFDPVLQPIRRATCILHSLIKSEKSKSVAQLLWSLWQAEILPEIADTLGYQPEEFWQNWPTRLSQQAKQATAVGRKADRDLDAVLALFDAADRSDRNFKANQSLSDFLFELTSQDAASETLIQRVQSGVSVLTAHRARGREWQLVIIVDLQEGVWPASNVRESIILPRDLSEQRLRLAEERRLAAAAAATAKEKLIVSVVSSKADQGTAPSSLLNVDKLTEVIGSTPPSMLTARGLIAQLRAAAINFNLPDALRQAAISRLGALAKMDDSRFSPADPSNWWFYQSQTESDRPLVSPNKKLEISGSMLESIITCPTQWFFERRIGIKDQPVANTVIGITIHNLAEKIIKQNLSTDESIFELEKIWPKQVFDADWQSSVQLNEAKKMVRALHDWLNLNQKNLIGTELGFKVLHAETDTILVGKIDLLQQNDNNEIEIIDFKTGASKPTANDLLEHPQLGIYQLAMSTDTDLNPDKVKVNAQLVQIRLRNTKDEVTSQSAPELSDASWLVEQINTARLHLLEEDLPAKPGPHCRNCRVRPVCPAVPEGDQVSA